MECPKCSKNVRETEGARCPDCSYAFGLDPKAPHGLSDTDLLRLTHQASVGGHEGLKRADGIDVGLGADPQELERRQPDRVRAVR